MAVTKLHSISDSVCGSLEYIVDRNKTRNHTLVESFMCETEPVRAAAEFRAVRERFGTGRSTTKAQHIIQILLRAGLLKQSINDYNIDGKRYIQSETL